MSNSNWHWNYCHLKKGSPVFSHRDAAGVWRENKLHNYRFCIDIPLSSVMHFKFTLHRKMQGKHSMNINILISEVYFNVKVLCFYSFPVILCSLLIKILVKFLAMLSKLWPVKAVDVEYLFKWDTQDYGRPLDQTSFITDIQLYIFFLSIIHKVYYQK